MPALCKVAIGRSDKGEAMWSKRMPCVQSLGPISGARLVGWMSHKTHGRRSVIYIRNEKGERGKEKELEGRVVQKEL